MANTKDEWWLTNSAGKRIGWLQPTTFQQQVALLMGNDMNQKAPILRFARWVGVGKSTAYRWADGTDPIPKWVAILLKATLQLRGLDYCWPAEVEAPWLPYSEGANGDCRTKPMPPDGDTYPTDARTAELIQESAARAYIQTTRTP